MSPASLLEADEPSPVELHDGGGSSSFVVVCDHAGRALPRALGTLGVAEEHLRSHIAWDIGAANVARRLGDLLGAPVFLQRYSRLVIDCNRPLGAADSIPIASGGVEIPGNHGLSRASAEARAQAIFGPYHSAISEALARRHRYLLVAMHSFTPELFGERRPFHAGVLHERDTRLAAPMLELLRGEPGLVVGDNEPYAASAATDYAIIEHGERRGAPYVELEVRQDLVSDEAGQERWAERFARLLQRAAGTFRF
jgi:predicted N-formylglutamate amidohydrolase